MAKRKDEYDYDFEFASFEDINSSFVQEPTKKNPLDYIKYGLGKFEDFFLNNLGKIIKIISFVVAVAILLVFLGIGIVLSMLDKFFVFIAVILFILGLIVAAISMFIIFGLGQVICQNDEILKKFNLKK